MITLKYFPQISAEKAQINSQIYSFQFLWKVHTQNIVIHATN